MNYQEATKYISEISRFGSHYTLDRMRALCAYLHNPEDSLKFIHVAGTDGKGSVTAYMTSVLREAGYKVGTYNSPYIYRYNERFLLDGTPATDRLVAKYLTEVRDAIDVLRSRDKDFYLTAFEIETATAFLMFKDQKCDVVVLEVGLGGRLDATNVIKQKEVAIVTSIGFDHCALLGNTLGQIAGEKAAIIIDDAVTCKQCDEVLDVIKSHSKRLVVAPSVEVVSRSIKGGQTFKCGGREYTIGLLGAYQPENASIVVSAVELLRQKGYTISDDAVYNGLKNAKWQVRFEVNECEGKLLVFDGAHNPHGAHALATSIKAYFDGKKVAFVIGILADKDEDGILSELLPLASGGVTFVQTTSARADTARALQTKAKALGFSTAAVSDDVTKAVQNALKSSADVVVTCGTLTLFENLDKSRLNLPTV